MSLRVKRGEFASPPNSESVSEFGGQTFSDRLRALIGSDSANAFAKECGVGGTSVRQYLHGGVPGLDKVIQIARAKNVRVEWLATGEGPRDIQSANNLLVEGTQQEQRAGMHGQVMQMKAIDLDMVSLPRLKIEASAGGGLVPIEEGIEGFIAIKREYLRMIDVNPEHAHIATLNGHSMRPTLMDRDLIIVDTSKTEVLNEHIYAVVFGEAVLAKRIQLLWDGSLRLMSDNKTEGYGDEIVKAHERNDLKIVGRIKGYLRHF